MSAQEIVNGVQDIFEFHAAQMRSIDEALRQRDLGIELVLERKSEYRAKVEAAIQYLAQDGEEFTSDTIRLMVGDPPRGVSTNLVGALFIAASRAKVIRAVGWTRSARVIGHANAVRTWIGAQS